MRARRLAAAALSLAAVAALAAGCSSPQAQSEGSSSRPSPSFTRPLPTTSAQVLAASRLVPLAPDQLPAARAEISALATQGRGPKTGYSRDEFGPAWTDDVGAVLWGHNGCRSQVICTPERGSP